MDDLASAIEIHHHLPEPWRSLLLQGPPAESGHGVPTLSPRLIERGARWVAPLYKYYFRTRIHGWERLPKAPAFIVANHSGFGTVEVLLLLYAWFQRFGHSRTVHGLAHQFLFRVPFLRDLIPRVGAVPAAPELARRILEAGEDLLVFPGGDWEAARPFYERKRIDFNNRHGFVRVSLETGVPVSPLVICGTHETVLILSRGDRIAHALRIDSSERVKIFPVTPQSIYAGWKLVRTLRGKSPVWTLPFHVLNGWLNLPWLPSRVTMELLEPIDLRRELQNVKGEKNRLARGYELVTGRMQTKLTELYARRRGYLG